MKPLPIGLQTFKNIVEGGFSYIDKTKYIYEMIKNKQGVYFLSRPRRFGRSLLLATLKEIFEGNKKLFKGLRLYTSKYQWETFPVIRFDFPTMKTAENIYIFEFKLQGIKEKALTQIKEKKYYNPYLEKNKPVHLIGVKFNPKTQEDYFEWAVEKI